jgi:hypothetical protein
MFWKVITLYQPWATLVAIEAKLFETRGWETGYRGPLAIHAGKTVDKQALEDRRIAEALNRAGYKYFKDLPTGQIIASTNLTNCLPITIDILSGEPMAGPRIVGIPERFFGDYRPGRFAWELQEIRKLKNPVFIKGAQGLWNYSGNLN